MKLTYFNASALKAKAAIQHSGKLLFNREATKLLNLTKDKSINIAIEEGTKNLYLQVLQVKVKEAFSINSSGDFFYLNTRSLFLMLEIDFTKNAVCYTISSYNHEGKDLFKLLPSAFKRKR